MKYYTDQHEWIKVEGDLATVGISDYAQEQLGDVVFVELPSIGKKVSQHGEAAIVESVKAASEVFAPVSGEVIEVNKELETHPDKVNQDPEGSGWFFKVKLTSAYETSSLMGEEAYQDFLKTIR